MNYFIPLWMDDETGDETDNELLGSTALQMCLV